MGDKTGIEWTNATWNPIRGCSRVSDGCRNCYAETVANRFKDTGMPYEGLIAKGGQWNGEIKLVPEKLEEPLRWTKPRMIFVNSMSDLFHEKVPEDFIWKVFAVMTLATRHTFQILTKRPERMRDFMIQFENSPDILGEWANYFVDWGKMPEIEEWPPKNIWLGVSVEDQETYEERHSILLNTPAAVRWISAEPLLDSIDFDFGAIDIGLEKDGTGSSALMGGIDWVVVGGESGSKARPVHPQWVRDIYDQCRNHSIPFFFKQWGEYARTGSMMITATRSQVLDGWTVWVRKKQVLSWMGSIIKTGLK